MKITGLILVGLAGGTAWTCYSRDDSPEDVADLLLPASDSVAVATDPGAWQSTFNSDLLVQEIRYGSNVEGADDDMTFLLSEFTRPDVNAEWAERVYPFSAPYDILYAYGQKKDRFFLVGKFPGSPDYEYVIERWTRKTMSLAEPQHAPGGSGAPSGDQQVFMKRKELYRDTTLRHIHAMAADPEGRFIMVLSGEPRNLVKIYMDGTTDLVLEEAQIPHLANVRGMAPRQHATEGRVWVLSGGVERTLVSDAANDGHFESAFTVDLSTWTTVYGSEAGVWTDDFWSVE